MSVLSGVAPVQLVRGVPSTWSRGSHATASPIEKIPSASLMKVYVYSMSMEATNEPLVIAGRPSAATMNVTEGGGSDGGGVAGGEGGVGGAGRIGGRVDSPAGGGEGGRGGGVPSVTVTVR